MELILSIYAINKQQKIFCVDLSNTMHEKDGLQTAFTSADFLI